MGRRSVEARATGAICAHCGTALGPDAVLWLEDRWEDGWLLLCDRCGREAFKWELTQPFVVRPLICLRCAGCGRELHRKVDRRVRVFETCSERCRARLVAARRRAARQTRMQHACAVCGQAFTGRRDAATCSPACRQKAYRQRQGTG